MKVEVVRSSRRRKTVQAREVDGVLRVSIPATMSAADEERWVAEMVRRIGRRTAAATVDLERRALALADRLDLPVPVSIRWAGNQEWRWGSCTPADGSVRISSRLAGEPAWVLDYVIVHELAHLVVPRHGPDFWDLVARYPLAERARGFLIARGSPAPGGAEGARGRGAGGGGCEAGGCEAGGGEPDRGADLVAPPATRAPRRRRSAAARS